MIGLCASLNGAATLRRGTENISRVQVPKGVQIDAPRSKTRREEMKAFIGAGIAAAAAASARKARAGDVAPQPATSRVEAMPVLSTLRTARDELEVVKKTLAKQKVERESYTKGAPAIIIATGSHSLAGMAAGVLSTLALHPIDTIKTRLQKGAKNLTDAVSQGNLYDGIVSNILKEAPNSAIYMTVVESVQTALLQAIPNARLLALFLAGGFGDLIGSICRVPAEMLNKRLQTGMSPDIGDACSKTFFTPEGRQLTRETWSVVIMRDVPHGAVQYMIFLGMHAPIAALLGHLALPASALPFLYDAIPGAIAGATGAYVTTPADVMVTNFATFIDPASTADAVPVEVPQAAASVANPEGSSMGQAGALQMPAEQRSVEPTSKSASERPSMLGIGKRIYEEEGIGGFFVGGLQRIFYYGPMSGVFFGLYEALDRIFYPVLLPTLTNPIMYNLRPEVAEVFESAERGAVDGAIDFVNFMERFL
eukprot:CAMPEP_0167776000 /NCGR_PEP_ID=MMETSP0111_2-20121227/2879_1 /TAXON_ID=91324 /ORGANISM="Lotharella globosa, Strain CCCM811" /LENGTH=480 /DNA_ID=CAMNT_0007665993 /DNA_START=75 /DNA_END=1517 /DNA_ORIENTATION=-